MSSSPGSILIGSSNNSLMFTRNPTDSFPSIIKKKNKSMINWNIDREKLSKCKNLEYDIDDRYKKIYISLIFDSINKKNDILNCRINENNKKFYIKIL